MNRLFIRRVPRIAGIILCVLAVAGCARSDRMSIEGESVVLRVAADGSAPFTSIQAAVDKAPEGAIVRVGPGHYVESVLIAKPLTLEGAGWEHTSLAPQGAEKDKLPGLVRKMEHEMHFAKTPAERNAVRQKMLEEVFCPPLLIKDAANVTVRGLRITQLPPDRARLPLAPFAAGVINAGAALERCAIVGSTRDGVQVIGASDASLSECLVAAAWGTGVVVEGVSGAETQPRARLVGSDIRNNHYAGVVIKRAGKGVAIERCRISGSAWHGVRYQDGSSPLIAHNAIFRNARMGLYAGGGPTAAQVRHNLLFANEMAGMFLEGESADLIERNTFARNRREALTFTGVQPSLQLEGNIFFENAGTLVWYVNEQRRVIDGNSARFLSPVNVWWPGDAGGGRGVYDPRAMAPQSVVEPRFADAAREDFRLADGWKAPWGAAGAADFAALASSWPIQPEEEAIIPPPHTRDSAHWTPPEQAWGVQVQQKQ